MAPTTKRRKTKFSKRHQGADRRVHAALAVVYELGAPVSAHEREVLMWFQRARSVPQMSAQLVRAQHRSGSDRVQLTARVWQEQVARWWRLVAPECTGVVDASNLFSNLMLDTQVYTFNTMSIAGFRVAAISVAQLAAPEET